jgi:hypothetical protein
LAGPAQTEAPDDGLTRLLNEAAADIAGMRVVDAVARITAFLRARPAEVARGRPGQWADLLRLAETHGVATDDVLVAAAHAPASVREGRASVPASVADYWRALQPRLDFRRALRGGVVDRSLVVALGPACSAWSLFNRWGFRDNPASIASFNPFCLAGHRAAAVPGLLRDGVDAYAPLDMLCAVAWRDGKTMIRRSDAAALWSHHVGDHWHADDFRLFRASIADLMANLDRALAAASGLPKVFVFAHTTVNQTAMLAPVCHRLAEVLDQRCRGPWRLLALNVPADPAVATAPRLEPLTATISLVQMPLPAGGTMAQWWEPGVYNTPAAMTWEGALAGLTRAAIEGWATPGG